MKEESAIALKGGLWKLLPGRDFRPLFDYDDLLCSIRKALNSSSLSGFE